MSRLTIYPELIDYVSRENHDMKIIIDAIIKGYKADAAFDNASFITIEVFDSTSGLVQRIKVKIDIRRKRTGYESLYEYYGTFQSTESAKLFVNACIKGFEIFMKDNIQKIKDGTM